MALIEIKDLSFYYPDAAAPALADISLTVNEGEFVLVAGPSGCGKSTLLRRLKPALSPFGKAEGSVLFAGDPIEELSLRRQTEEIGFVMQSPEMQIATDKVWHELAFALESLGVDQTSMRMRVAEMANFFGIQSWFSSETAALSGGQKQILCLASVMVVRPRLLLLDEPTSQLDPIAASEFFDTLRRINSELGTTIIITEHRTESLFPAVDKVVFMREGRIAAEGSPRDFAELSENTPELNAVLPTALNICAGTGGKGPVPLTVREGRDYIKAVLESGSAAPVKPERSERAEAGETLISMREAWFRYERNAPDILKGAELSVRKGELLCLLGGNGAGKTTAIMCASGLYKPYRGRVLLGGKPIDSLKASELYGKRVAVLMQDPLLGFTKETVREELEAVRRAHKLDPARIDEIVAEMEIESILESHPYDISGGEVQRAALAKLLLPGPEVLFLDEATKGMDAFFKKKFGALLHSLTRGGTAVVLVSHDIEFAAEYADRIALFADGGVIAEGTPREVLTDNSFYTTAAARIARGLIPGALLTEDIVNALNGRKLD